MKSPTVTFLVPCYKLAHLLKDCIDSILSQTYCDFEVLIMDDCSPDNTPEVAASLRDNRVKHIRNNPNLGHLRNYNKGIQLASGKYIWLISADDRLRRPYVLERYVQLMEVHPEVGYVCCPGIELKNGTETRLLSCGYYGDRDRIFNGRKFIATSLRRGYGLMTPSVMVRRQCYDQISLFPVDMPHQGDMYLWYRWALHYDVAYISEPMVNYRSHELNIMKDLLHRVPDTVFQDEVNVLWRTSRHCEEQQFPALSRKCEDVLAAKYARAAASGIYRDVYSKEYLGDWKLSIAQCDQAIRAGATSAPKYRRLRGKFSAYMGNQHWRHGAFARARQSYMEALRSYWAMPVVWMKLLLLLGGLGRVGMLIRSLGDRRSSAIPTTASQSSI